MNNQNMMQVILIAILLLCGYFYLYQAVAKRTVNRAALPLIAVLLLLIYGLISVALILILGQTNSLDFVFMALLILVACIGVFAVLTALYRHFHEIRKGMLVLFLLYLLIVAYITIFSRPDNHSSQILLQFDSIKEALRLRSLAPLQHLWLNVVLFIPIGLLFSAIDERLAKWRYVLPLGLMLTTLIETTQLLLHLGQCDLEDLAANTAGATVGLLIYRLYRRLAPAEEA